MIEKTQIEKLVTEHLGNGALFLVYFNINRNNSITVVIDGDNGVSISDCIALSRFIEHKLDRDKEDFELNILSSGLDYPFASVRQYTKNLSRSVNVLLNNGKQLRGILLDANDKQIKLQEEIIKKNKKNIKVIKGEICNIPLSEINQTKTIVKF